MDNKVDYLDPSQSYKDDKSFVEPADPSDDSEWIETSKRDKKSAQKLNEDQINDTLPRVTSDRRENHPRSRPIPSSSNTNITPKTATIPKVFDGKNFVEAPLPITNAWRKTNSEKSDTKNDSSTYSTDSGSVSSKENNNSINTPVTEIKETINQASATTTTQSGPSEIIKPLSEIIVPANTLSEIKETTKQKNKDASTTTTSPGINKVDKSLSRASDNNKNRAHQYGSNNKVSKNRQDSEPEKKPRTNPANNSNQSRGKDRTESCKKWVEKDGGNTVTNKELDDSAHWPRLNKDEDINSIQTGTQNPVQKNDKAYLPSSTPLSTATDTDGDNDADIRMKETRSNLRGMTPQVLTDSSGDDSSTKNDAQTTRGKKKNLKWKRMDFDLPKTEHKRRGGSRPRVEGRDRDNKDRPPSMRRRDRGDRGDKDRERDQPGYMGKDGDGKFENSTSPQNLYRREKDDNRQWSQDRHNRGASSNRGSKRTGYQPRPHFNSRTYRTSGNVYAPQVFEPSIQYFYSPVYFGHPAPAGTLQYYNTPPVYFETPHLSKIRLQIEYYFSESNLSTDFFIRRQMDAQGWVTLDLLKTFRRVKELTDDDQIIIEAMVGSDSVEVSNDRQRLRPKIHPQRWTIAGSNPTSFSALKVDVAEFVPGRYSDTSVKTQTIETTSKIDQSTSFSPKHMFMEQVNEITSTLNGVSIATEDI